MYFIKIKTPLHKFLKVNGKVVSCKFAFKEIST